MRCRHWKLLKLPTKHEKAFILFGIFVCSLEISTKKLEEYVLFFETNILDSLVNKTTNKINNVYNKNCDVYTYMYKCEN